MAASNIKKHGVWKYKSVNIGVEIVKYIGEENSVVTPAVIEEQPVIKIGDNAFNGCTQLTQITLPCSATFYPETFRGCAALSKLTFTGKVSSVPTITESEKYNFLSSLADDNSSVLLKAFHGIGIFDGLPKGIKTIGNAVFSCCDSLTNVVLPEDLKEVKTAMFRACSALTQITIPDAAKKIAANAFKDCSALSKIVIPASVEIIWHNSFDGCKNLVIYAPLGSYAEEYAKQNDIKFEAV